MSICSLSIEPAMILHLLCIQAAKKLSNLFIPTKYDPLYDGETVDGYVLKHFVPTSEDLFGDVSFLTLNVSGTDDLDTDAEAVIDLINNAHPTVLALQGVKETLLNALREKLVSHYTIVNDLEYAHDAVTGERTYVPLIVDTEICQVNRTGYFKSGKPSVLYASYAEVVDNRIGENFSYTVINGDIYSSFADVVSAMFFNITNDVAEAGLDSKPVVFLGNMGTMPSDVKRVVEISYKNVLDADINNKKLPRTTDHTKGNEDNIQRDFILIRDPGNEFVVNYARILRNFTNGGKYPVQSILTMKKNLKLKAAKEARERKEDREYTEKEISRRIEEHFKEIQAGMISEAEIREGVRKEVRERCEERERQQEESESRQEEASERMEEVKMEQIRENLASQGYSEEKISEIMSSQSQEDDQEDASAVSSFTHKQESSSADSQQTSEERGSFKSEMSSSDSQTNSQLTHESTNSSSESNGSNGSGNSSSESNDSSGSSNSTSRSNESSNSSFGSDDSNGSANSSSESNDSGKSANSSFGSNSSGKSTNSTFESSKSSNSISESNESGKYTNSSLGSNDSGKSTNSSSGSNDSGKSANSSFGSDSSGKSTNSSSESGKSTNSLSESNSSGKSTNSISEKSAGSSREYRESGSTQDSASKEQGIGKNGSLSSDKDGSSNSDRGSSPSGSNSEESSGKGGESTEDKDTEKKKRTGLRDKIRSLFGVKPPEKSFLISKSSETGSESGSKSSMSSSMSAGSSSSSSSSSMSSSEIGISTEELGGKYMDIETGAPISLIDLTQNNDSESKVVEGENSSNGEDKAEESEDDKTDAEKDRETDSNGDEKTVSEKKSAVDEKSQEFDKKSDEGDVPSIFDLGVKEVAVEGGKTVKTDPLTRKLVHDQVDIDAWKKQKISEENEKMKEVLRRTGAEECNIKDIPILDDKALQPIKMHPIIDKIVKKDKELTAAEIKSKNQKVLEETKKKNKEVEEQLKKRQLMNAKLIQQSVCMLNKVKKPLDEYIKTKNMENTISNLQKAKGCHCQSNLYPQSTSASTSPSIMNIGGHPQITIGSAYPSTQTRPQVCACQSKYTLPNSSKTGTLAFGKVNTGAPSTPNAIGMTSATSKISPITPINSSAISSKNSTTLGTSNPEICGPNSPPVHTSKDLSPPGLQNTPSASSSISVTNPSTAAPIYPGIQPSITGTGLTAPNTVSVVRSPGVPTSQGTFSPVSAAANTLSVGENQVPQKSEVLGVSMQNGITTNTGVTSNQVPAACNCLEPQKTEIEFITQNGTRKILGLREGESVSLNELKKQSSAYTHEGKELSEFTGDCNPPSNSATSLVPNTRTQGGLTSGLAIPTQSGVQNSTKSDDCSPLDNNTAIKGLNSQSSSSVFDLGKTAESDLTISTFTPAIGPSDVKLDPSQTGGQNCTCSSKKDAIAQTSINQQTSQKAFTPLNDSQMNPPNVGEKFMASGNPGSNNYGQVNPGNALSQNCSCFSKNNPSNKTSFQANTIQRQNANQQTAINLNTYTSDYQAPSIQANTVPLTTNIPTTMNSGSSQAKDCTCLVNGTLVDTSSPEELKDTLTGGIGLKTAVGGQDVFQSSESLPTKLIGPDVQISTVLNQGIDTSKTCDQVASKNANTSELSSKIMKGYIEVTDNCQSKQPSASTKTPSTKTPTANTVTVMRNNNGSENRPLKTTVYSTPGKPLIVKESYPPKVVETPKKQENECEPSWEIQEARRINAELATKTQNAPKIDFNKPLDSISCDEAEKYVQKAACELEKTLKRNSGQKSPGSKSSQPASCVVRNVKKFKVPGGSITPPISGAQHLKISDLLGH